ncbi:hypothetical protein RSOLAG22IIIB_05734 [Rhizoctonia solani]|uniref:F-box domain-containing protein n=1 Tax=Rhizoctonia solani TaxID=456999 RepID=A0A0K6G8Y8_9AGAM|nr:hypothetical protein RSOLAG22IIIB_05734 [Rhizoctonia solani]
MLHRDAPFGLARYRGLVEPLRDPEPRKHTAPGPVSRHTKAPSAASQTHGGLLPEDIMVIIIAYSSVADVLVVRRCSKWLKYLTEDRHIWLAFLLQPTFPVPECISRVEVMSSQELESQVRRQFELSRRWSPKAQPETPVRPLSLRTLQMPNNEFLTAMASMDSWVAVASDLGGVYVCAPFGENNKMGLTWIRVLSFAGEINKLGVDVSNGRVSVMWAGSVREDGALSYRCGVVSALVEDLVSAQSHIPGGLLLNSSGFVAATTLDLRNPASEIMDIAIGERYCAVVDAAHVFQVFIYPPLASDTPSRSEFEGPHRSSRKTISLQFLPYDQLLVISDSFIAVYKPVTSLSTTMERKYWTHVPTETFFGLLTQRRSSNITTLGHMRIPILAFGSTGTEITHYDLRVPSSEPEGSEPDDYGLTHRRSFSYLLSPSLGVFSMGTINGGGYRMAWITTGISRLLCGIAFGRASLGNYDPSKSYQAPLDRFLLDLGEYGDLVKMHSPSGPLFAFHEGEGMLLGGVRRGCELIMLQY